jgi:hypothetical protein
MIKYVPLADRLDWDGSVETVAPILVDSKNYGRTQGKKKRAAIKKRTLGKAHR